MFGREAFRSAIEDRPSVLPLYCLPCVLPLSLLSCFRSCKGNVARLFDSAAADNGAIGTMLPKSCPGRSCMTTLSSTEQLYILMMQRRAKALLLSHWQFASAGSGRKLCCPLLKGQHKDVQTSRERRNLGLFAVHSTDTWITPWYRSCTFITPTLAIN